MARLARLALIVPDEREEGRPEIVLRQRATGEGEGRLAVVIDDAVVIPLLNDDFITMINSRIRGFETNSLEILDFSAIFIKEPK